MLWFNLILGLNFFLCFGAYMVTREDKGDREGIPHTHPIDPIPLVIRLELFLESG